MAETFTVIDFDNKLERKNFFRQACYKWEFLRRNKNYIKDLKKYCTPIQKSKGVIYQPKPETPNNYFPEKYNIHPPINPKYSFEKLLKFKDRKRGLYALPSLLSLIMSFPHIDLPMKTSLMPIKCHHITNTDITLELRKGEPYFCLLTGAEIETERKFDPPKYDFQDITLRVNLNASKEFIHKRVKQIVTLWKDQYDKYYPIRHRNRYKEYARYLEVYDLKEMGWSWEKLVKKFYKKHIGFRDYKYLVREVKRDYERCKEVIDGGYRQIR